jgi:hypothetical protein
MECVETVLSYLGDDCFDFVDECCSFGTKQYQLRDLKPDDTVLDLACMVSSGFTVNAKTSKPIVCSFIVPEWVEKSMLLTKRGCFQTEPSPVEQPTKKMRLEWDWFRSIKLDLPDTLDGVLGFIDDLPFSASREKYAISDTVLGEGASRKTFSALLGMI